jgi:hypothetical protein
MKAEQVYDGVPFEIEGSTVDLICCECSLTHHVKITKRRGKKRGYRLTFWTDNRSTAARRRANAISGTARASRRRRRGPERE